MKKRYWLIFWVIFWVMLISFTIILSGCGSGIYLKSGQNRYTVEEAKVNLKKLTSRIKDVKYVNTDIADIGLDAFVAADIATLLPDFELIHEPVVQEPPGSRYITVFSSTEKATDNATDRWLIDMANEFNRTNGQDFGIRLYGVASGMAYDYIRSGKYVPDLFTPSSRLWGDGIGLTPYEERLVGNVAGIVTKKNNPKTLEQLINAVMNEGFKFGYTNPNSSTTGYNFLRSYLEIKGADTFEEFQRKIPFVAYTTGQMRDATLRGVLDGFVYEAQVFESGSREIKNDYVFTPFGARHDNPVYILNEGNRDICEAFTRFCLTDQAQRSATSLGFNRYNDYRGLDLDGSTIEEDRILFKEKKSGGQNIASVFVCDISGSMQGSPILQLKTSLLECAKHISESNSIGMVTYSTNVNVVLPIARYDVEQRAKLINVVENMYPSGSTATNDAISIALQMLCDYQETNPNTRLNVFVLTDGDTNLGLSFDTCKDVWQSLQIPIYAIGYNNATGDLSSIAGLTEAAKIDVTEQNVLYVLANFFRAQM